jgi:hypothetical protein
VNQCKKVPVATVYCGFSGRVVFLFGHTQAKSNRYAKASEGGVEKI